MLRVLCCYTDLRPGTRAALAVHAPAAELVDVSGDPFAYSAQLTSRWDGTAALVVVEHDIVIHDAVMPAFAACPEPWCLYPYWLRPGGPWLAHGLGCARFTAAVQRLVPAAELLAPRSAGCEVCAWAGSPVRPGCWRHVDACVAWALDAAGVRPHVHQPGVGHER